MFELIVGRLRIADAIDQFAFAPARYSCEKDGIPVGEQNLGDPVFKAVEDLVLLCSGHVFVSQELA